MPKTREQIKHDTVTNEVWRDNRTQIGGLWFDPRLIQPTGDHILVELDDETPPSKILAMPDVARGKDIGTRFGTTLKVGPGKWKQRLTFLERNGPLSWVLSPWKFTPTTLKPGMRVAIGHYSDWESWFSDYEGRGRNVVLCQEADVRVLLEESCAVGIRQ
jgi:hypothetical protein